MRQTKEEIRREQEKIAPGSGLRAAIDRGAWSATGSRIAGEWNWAGLLGGVATFAVMAIILIFGLDVSPEGLVAGLGGYAVVLARGRYLHDRYVKRIGSS